MDVTIIIPGEYSELVSEVEDDLAARLPYWDTRYHSVKGALNRWAVVVEKLGRYDGYIEEYIHDLGFRDVLVDILEVARWPLTAWLLRVVDELDDQFHVKTTLDRDDLMWGGNVDRPLHWWHRRLPPDDGLRNAIHMLAPEMRAHREAARQSYHQRGAG